MSALATKDLLRKILPARLYSFETKYAHGDDSLLCIFTVNKKQQEKRGKECKSLSRFFSVLSTSEHYFV